MDNHKPVTFHVAGNVDLETPVRKAAEILLTGGLVAFPTETFYGLAVDIRNKEAINRLFAAKKRPATRPVLILVADVKMLEQYVETIPPAACRLMQEFWPGGLTLVFKAGRNVSPLLTAGTGKIGIRLSSHPIATALARAINAPITGTSANISDKPACTRAGEVVAGFGSSLDLILDGGRTPGEAGSTILDVTCDPLRILRQGVVPRDQLKKCCLNVI